MKKYCAILTLLIFCSVPLLLWAQTSVVCTAVGYCGNSLTGSGTDFDNNNSLFGQPFTINAAYTVSNIKVVTNTGSGNIAVYLVCDSNTTGAYIGNASPCSSTNVLCYATAAWSASTTMTFTPSCSLTLTNVRYWLFQNTDTASNHQELTTTGSPVTSYASVAVACCTNPVTFTNSGETMNSAGESFAMGVTLASTGGVVRHRGSVIQR